MSSNIQDLQAELAALQKQLNEARNKLPKKPKIKEVNGQSYLPIGMSGKAMLPITGDQAKAQRIKNLRGLASDCRKQAEIYTMKAVVFDNQARSTDGQDTVPVEPEIAKYRLTLVRDYFVDVNHETIAQWFNEIINDEDLWKIL